MIEYRAQSRNGYTAVDLYEEIDGRQVCRRTVEVFPTRKLAESAAAALNDAVSQGLAAGALSMQGDIMEAYRRGVAKGRTMGPVTEGERMGRIRGMD